MIEIEFIFDTEGTPFHDAFLDPYELDMMFEHTRASIQNDLDRKLGLMRCEEHHQPPRFKISGQYNYEIEQIDLQYHVDTCCQPFLLRVVAALNLRN